jgi:CHAT domain-containing protein
LEKAVVNVTDAERSRPIIDFYLNRLYRVLVTSIREHLVGGKIILIPGGIFSQVPFMALRDDDGSYLHHQYRLVTVVDPTDLQHRRRIRTSLAAKRNAVFAVSSDLLPFIDVEAEAIRESFPACHLYVNEHASLKNLADELRRSDGFVHIAAHASRASENPLFSRILMTDGPFFPFDLFGRKLSAGLVTLSGCQTAAPGLYYGNSFSLAKAFYQAGSRFVLASLWPVSDKLSTIFMIEFYRFLRQREDALEAYRGAVDKLVEITGNPAFWGSFVLLGI